MEIQPRSHRHGSRWGQSYPARPRLALDQYLAPVLAEDDVPAPQAQELAYSASRAEEGQNEAPVPDTMRCAGEFVDLVRSPDVLGQYPVLASFPLYPSDLRGIRKGFQFLRSGPRVLQPPPKLLDGHFVAFECRAREESAASAAGIACKPGIPDPHDELDDILPGKLLERPVPEPDRHSVHVAHQRADSRNAQFLGQEDPVESVEHGPVGLRHGLLHGGLRSLPAPALPAVYSSQHRLQRFPFLALMDVPHVITRYSGVSVTYTCRERTAPGVHLLHK